MESHELKRWMQSVRAGSPALGEDAFAPLAEHLRQHPEDRAAFERELQFDALLASALHEAPLPEGLEERLLARLQTAQLQATQLQAAPALDESAPFQGFAASGTEARRVPASTTPAAEAASAVDAAPSPLPAAETAPTDQPAASVGTQRRNFIRWWAASLAGGILAIIGGQWWYEANRPAGWDEILAEARRSIAGAQALGGPAAWQSPSTAPASHGLGPWLDRRQVVGWLPSPPFLNRTAVVYWLADPEGKAQGYLFVATARRTGPLPNAPGSFENSGGVWATTWRSGDSLYALAAVGERADLERAHYFLRPLTLTRRDVAPPPHGRPSPLQQLAFRR